MIEGVKVDERLEFTTSCNSCLGLRTLELCVDNLQPEYFYDHMVLFLL